MRLRLTVTSDLSSNRHVNYEGSGEAVFFRGRPDDTRFITVSVELADLSGKPTKPPSRVALVPRLRYQDGGKTDNLTSDGEKSLLTFRPSEDLYLDPTRARIKFQFRIEDVSSKHDGKLFLLHVLASPPAISDGILDAPIKVMSHVPKTIKNDNEKTTCATRNDHRPTANPFVLSPIPLILSSRSIVECMQDDGRCIICSQLADANFFSPDSHLSTCRFLVKLLPEILASSGAKENEVPNVISNDYMTTISVKGIAGEVEKIDCRGSTSMGALKLIILGSEYVDFSDWIKLKYRDDVLPDKQTVDSLSLDGDDMLHAIFKDDFDLSRLFEQDKD